MATKIYGFISYNRKVITPSSSSKEVTCTPDFEIKYRWAYIIVIGLISSVILHHYTESINTFAGWSTSFYRELFVCFGQVAWQSVMFHKWKKEMLYEYLGNMMTVSMIGSILLLPMLFIQCIVDVHVYISIVYFFAVVGIMLLEHLRRCKILGLGFKPSFSWVAYRAIVVIILTILN